MRLGEMVMYRLSPRDHHELRDRLRVPYIIRGEDVREYDERRFPNLPRTGDALVMIVTDPGLPDDMVSGQCLLNWHYPPYWVGSVYYGDEPGQWDYITTGEAQAHTEISSEEG